MLNQKEVYKRIKKLTGKEFKGVETGLSDTIEIYNIIKNDYLLSEYLSDMRSTVDNLLKSTSELDLEGLNINKDNLREAGIAFNMISDYDTSTPNSLYNVGGVDKLREDVSEYINTAINTFGNDTIIKLDFLVCDIRDDAEIEGIVLNASDMEELLYMISDNYEDGLLELIYIRTLNISNLSPLHDTFIIAKTHDCNKLNDIIKEGGFRLKSRV